MTLNKQLDSHLVINFLLLENIAVKRGAQGSANKGKLEADGPRRAERAPCKNYCIFISAVPVIHTLIELSSLLPWQRALTLPKQERSQQIWVGFKPMHIT